MSKTSIQDLNGVAETLIIPLYFRAVESQRPDALVKDEKAVELVKQLDYDFSKLKRLSSEQLTVLVRQKVFDQCVRAFLVEHPNGVVVDIGCGLNTRFYRVDNGLVEWYDLDLPQVIALRKRFLDETSRCHFIGCSVLDTSWMDIVGERTERGFLFLAEGVLPYFEETEVRRLMLMLTERFPGAELVFDAMSPFFIKVHNLQLSFSKVEARLRWGLKHSKGLEGWVPGIRLLSTWGYFDQPEPRLGWLRLLRLFPPMGAWILRYRLGEKVASYHSLEPTAPIGAD